MVRECVLVYNPDMLERSPFEPTPSSEHVTANKTYDLLQGFPVENSQQLYELFYFVLLLNLSSPIARMPIIGYEQDGQIRVALHTDKSAQKHEHATLLAQLGIDKERVKFTTSIETITLFADSIQGRPHLELDVSVNGEQKKAYLVFGKGSDLDLPYFTNQGKDMLKPLFEKTEGVTAKF